MAEEDVTKQIDFVVIGAMKSGTVSVSNNLRTSDTAFLIPDYFGTRPDLFGPNRHAGYEKKTLEDIESARNERGKNLRIGHVKGDYYINRPAMEDLLTRPSLKLIMTYRDPAGRLFSHYNHSVKQGYTRLDFERWCKTEDGEYGIKLSSFGACLSEFADRLSPERFGILSMSQTADRTALHTLCRFLGIADPEPSPQVHHATPKPRNRTLNYLARNSIDTLLPRGSKVNAKVNKLRQKLLLSEQKPEKPPEALRRKWEEYFAADFETFRKLAQPFLFR